ncbi:ABC transporter permease [Streptomyces sp. NBC_00727]|uniref:ABC transporter permease n=1 Tax=Streptomyces sp. NBC_00727 TaxID=2903675 RepID=UPI00386E5734
MSRLNLRRASPKAVGIAPSAFARRDLFAEALAGMLQRPARAVLTALGTVLGVGTFVAVLGLTATASSQIDARFSVLSATEVTVEDTGGPDAEAVSLSFPDDADERIEALNGVEAAGVYWPVRLPGEQRVRSSPVAQSAGGERAQVLAASSGVLQAAQPSLKTGRVYDSFHSDRHERVAVLGSHLAARLGITTVDTQPALFIGDESFTVIGLISDVERKSDLLMSVVVPQTAAQDLWGLPGRDSDRAKMLISTRIGAASQIASETALALDPAHPERFKVIPPPDPKTLRSNVSSDLDQLLLLLATVCLVIGSVGIANTTLVAVMERTSEIGLRRALGARGRHITGQFLAESGFLGTLGGLAGTSLGVLAVVSVAVTKEWTPVLDPAVVACAPALGLATGLVAGVYPAWRASRVQPVEALRR